MINHLVLIKLSDVTRRDFCVAQLQSLERLDNCESIVVAPELGQAPNRWDIAVISQHRDATQLEEFRVDEFHRQVGGEVAPFVEAMSSVDFDSDRVAVSA